MRLTKSSSAHGPSEGNNLPLISDDLAQRPHFGGGLDNLEDRKFDYSTGCLRTGEINSSKLLSQPINCYHGHTEPLTGKNKKFLRIIEGSYEKRLRDLDIEGDGTHPYNFDKVEIGKRLAEIAVDSDKVPEDINAFLDQLNVRLN